MNTHKDYSRAVKIVKERKRGLERNAVAIAFADFFKAENPRFNESRFYETCDLDDEG